MNLKELKELIEMLKNTDISGAGDRTLRRQSEDPQGRRRHVPSRHAAHGDPPAAHCGSAVLEPGKPAPEKAPEPVKTNQIKVTSPIVGTFTARALPTSPPMSRSATS